MSKYSADESVKKHKLGTYLDNAGQLLSLPRFENETLSDYKDRLLDHVRNRANSSRKGLNNAIPRMTGVGKKHILTLDVIDSSIIEPYVEITSKYLRLISDSVVDLQLDLHDLTIGDINLTIEASSTSFKVSYYDDTYQNIKGTKLLYDNNIRLSGLEFFNNTKLARLQNGHIINLNFSSDKHRIKKASINDVTGQYDYFINNNEGIVYTGDINTDAISYLYYDMPYKIYYSPIVWYPLNDKDIDDIIKDSVLTDDGIERLILNSRGADIINELTSIHPLTWGS